MADTFEVGGIHYETTGTGEATAVSSDYSFGGAVTIPSKVSYIKDDVEITVKVTGIEAEVFKRKAVTSVVLPSTIKTLPAELFRECDKLEAVTLPEDISELPGAIFADCSSLKSLDIPAGVAMIGESAFSGCALLTSVNLPGGLTSIESNTFNGCSSLKSLDIPAGVTMIGKYAFSGCALLTSVNLPVGLTSIESNTFNGCSSLKSLAIPTSVGKIGESAFEGCTSLQTVVLPAGLTSIENSLFLGCESLTSVNIPENVVSIGKSAFAGCAALEEITLPDGVKTLGNNCFSRSGLTSFVFPESLESIGGYCFGGAEKIQEMTINAGFKSFGAGAFDVKDSFYIKKVFFKGSLEDWLKIDYQGDNYPEGTSPVSIAKEFYYTKGGSFVLLEGVLEVPAAITEIKPYALYRYKKINGLKFSGKNLTIPMFALIPQWIKNIVYTGTVEDWLTGNFNGLPYGPGISLKLGGDGFDGKVAIPKGITRIPEGRLAYPEVCEINDENDVIVVCKKGFYGSGLRSASFLAHVDSIGESAFEFCPLTEVSLSPNLGTIPDFAFAQCPSLQSVSIAARSNSATSVKGIVIGAGAFINDANLKTLNLPPFIKVGADAFRGAGIFESQPDGLVYFNSCLFGFKGAGAVPSALEIKPGTISVAANAFSAFGNPSITKLTIPDGVLTIGDSAFEGQGMTSVNVPGSVSYLGDRAFAGCSALSSVSLNEGLEYLGNSFESTTSLKSLTLPASVKTAFLPSMETLVIKDSSEPLNYFGGSSVVQIAVKDRLYIGRSLNPVVTDSRFDYILRVNVEAQAQTAATRASSLPTSIEFGEKVSNVGGMLEFYGSPTDKVICYSATAPDLGEVYFMNEAYDKSILMVPTGAVESYRKQSPWSRFANIAEGAVSGVESVRDAATVSVRICGNIINVDGVEDGERIEIYDASGRLIAQGTAPAMELPTNAGTLIIRVAGKSQKVIR